MEFSNIYNRAEFLNFLPRNVANFDSYFILALLNSKLLNYWFGYNYSFTKIQGGYFDLRGTQIESIPLPKIEKESQQPFIEIVDKILEAKKADPKADTTALEAQIGQIVYTLYNLTEEEIKIIEK